MLNHYFSPPPPTVGKAGFSYRFSYCFSSLFPKKSGFRRWGSVAASLCTNIQQPMCKVIDNLRRNVGQCGMYSFSAVVKMSNLNRHTLASLDSYNTIIYQLIALLVLSEIALHAVCLFPYRLIIKPNGYGCQRSAGRFCLLIQQAIVTPPGNPADSGSNAA